MQDQFFLTDFQFYYRNVPLLTEKVPADEILVGYPSNILKTSFVDSAGRVFAKCSRSRTTVVQSFCVRTKMEKKFTPSRSMSGAISVKQSHSYG